MTSWIRILETIVRRTRNWSRRHFDGLRGGRTRQERCLLLSSRKLVLWYQRKADNSHFVPRAVLFDLEPRVIDSIRESEYKDFFNPENMSDCGSFIPIRYVGSNGNGAGNNWGAGFEQARSNREVAMDILTREAENSDSLEVAIGTLFDIGLHVDTQHLGRHGFRHGFLPPGESPRRLSEETDPNILRVSQHGERVRRGRPGVQLHSDDASPRPARRLRRRSGQRSSQHHRDGPSPPPQPLDVAGEFDRLHRDGCIHRDDAISEVAIPLRSSPATSTTTSSDSFPPSFRSRDSTSS